MSAPNKRFHLTALPRGRNRRLGFWSVLSSNRFAISRAAGEA
jgi:hypothetical protein